MCDWSNRRLILTLNQRHYAVIDLEATCWSSKEKAAGPNENIEIGLTILSPRKEELWSGGWFVRPIICPLLSAFCRELTSITQFDVDRAPPFPAAMTNVEHQIKAVTGLPANQTLFVSWGDYDRKQFMRVCALHAYSYPFGDHWNLKREFMRRYGLKRTGLDEACRLIGIPMLGTHHRGKDDAANVARVLQVLGDKSEEE